jgi:hypothetical protein
MFSGKQLEDGHTLRSVNLTSQMYFTTTSMLTSREFELQRVQNHFDLLIKSGIPLLAALEKVAVAKLIPMEWIHNTAQKLSKLVVELLEAEKDFEGRCVM